MDPPRQTLKSACKKGSGPAKVKMDNQRNTQPTSSIPVKHGTPNLLGLTYHISCRHGMCQSRPNDAIPNPGGHLCHPSEKYEPQLSLAAIGTPRDTSPTSKDFPPWGHTLLARVKVEGTSSRSDRTPARGHRIHGTLVAGFNGI